MSRWLPVALVLVVLGGVAAFGLLRPGVDPGRDPADVQHRLDAIPRKLSGWACGDDMPLSERAVNVGRFQAYLNRTYTHPDGAAVSVLVLYGEPGDIGAHDPRQCYAGSGWELDGTPDKRAVGKSGSGVTTELWSARFRKQNESLQVYWGWGVNGDWRADDNPRFTFARHRRILKVYAQRLLPPGATAVEPTHDPLAEFVPTFLQCVDDALPPPDR
jgi:EpsI family protein